MEKTIHNQVIDDYNNLFPEEGIIVIDGVRKEYTEKWFFRFYVESVVNTLIVDKDQNVIFVFGAEEGFKSKFVGKKILEVREIIHTKLYKTVCYREFKDLEEFSTVCKENLNLFLQDALKYEKYCQRIADKQAKLMNSSDWKLGLIKHNDLPFPKKHEFGRHFEKVLYYKKEPDLIAKHTFKNCPNLIHFYEDRELFPREDFE